MSRLLLQILIRALLAKPVGRQFLGWLGDRVVAPYIITERLALRIAQAPGRLLIEIRVAALCLVGLAVIGLIALRRTLSCFSMPCLLMLLRR